MSSTIISGVGSGLPPHVMSFFPLDPVGLEAAGAADFGADDDLGAGDFGENVSGGIFPSGNFENAIMDVWEYMC